MNFFRKTGESMENSRGVCRNFLVPPGKSIREKQNGIWVPITPTPLLIVLFSFFFSKVVPFSRAFSVEAEGIFFFFAQ